MWVQAILLWTMKFGNMWVSEWVSEFKFKPIGDAGNEKKLDQCRVLNQRPHSSLFFKAVAADPAGRSAARLFLFFWGAGVSVSEVSWKHWACSGSLTVSLSFTALIFCCCDNTLRGCWCFFFPLSRPAHLWRFALIREPPGSEPQVECVCMCLCFPKGIVPSVRFESFFFSLLASKLSILLWRTLLSLSCRHSFRH